MPDNQTENQQVLIDSLPKGRLSAGNYRLASSPVPEPGADEVLIAVPATPGRPLPAW
jgi:hypothetical protein